MMSPIDLFTITHYNCQYLVQKDFHASSQLFSCQKQPQIHHR